MKILVIGGEASWDELTGTRSSIQWERINDIEDSRMQGEAKCIFNLSADASLQDYSGITQPVFINSVSKTLREINAENNVVRINGWNGFLKRTSWEVAGDLKDPHHVILTALNKKAIITPDEPGFISARIISMIVNEAFYAKEENISTENEIDIAMKLGTNYPYGPFEWGKQIGLKNIYELLLALGKTDIKYKPCSLLEKKAKHQ